MIDVWRGDFLESRHRGHAIVCDAAGDVVAEWGDPDTVILPRSACKMIQALPLVESGAADAFGLGTAQLALACASHNGAAVHTEPVQGWLTAMDLTDADLRCGPETPRDPDASARILRTGGTPCQWHNNCSGKHTGFLTLTRHLKAGPEYVEIDHPVQRAVRDAFEDTTGLPSPGHGIDGCSAPNFATPLRGLARAMARFAAPGGSDGRAVAARRLVDAMRLHPDLVAGEGRACTDLMRATDGKVAVKTGAEGVYTAILPERGLGVALKIEDGATRASNAAMTAILIGLGALDPNHPAAEVHGRPEVRNRRDLVVGRLRPADGVF